MKSLALTGLFLLLCAGAPSCVTGAGVGPDSGWEPPRVNASLSNQDLQSALRAEFPLGMQRILAQQRARAMGLDQADAAWARSTSDGQRVLFPVRRGEQAVYMKGWEYAGRADQNDAAHDHYYLTHGIRAPKGFVGCIYADFPERLLSLRFDSNQLLDGVDVGPALGTLSGTVYQPAFAIEHGP